ncbi:MAG TPA: GyrI-like domain-containing protein [Chloroflexota bacterium]|nr:GyrI-like domain-containing protein [Chloroflexota bacterium]
MAKIDVKKQLKHLYEPSQDVTVVDVPPMHFLMIDGHGDPNTSADYADAIAALYALSYAIKFLVKKSAAAIDYGVMPLEGLWWADDPAVFVAARKADWDWTMMIMQPDCVTSTTVAEARAQAAHKDLPALPRLRFETYHEGLAAQIMHIGPYAAEGPTIERLHRFIAEHGYRLMGKHHEIYLSDPRRTAPERMRTVLRQPMCS